MHWRNRRRVRQRASRRSFSFNLRFPGQYFDAETALNYNYFRNFDPAVGRYVESDPIGVNGGINTYAYVKGNPLILTDPLGTKPGDSFPNAQAAAVDALNYINTKPECGTHEYAGWVYKEWSLFEAPTYTYDEPTELGPAGGVMPSMPTFHGVYAMFHNHPPLPGYDSDNYSPADENTADNLNIPSYLETPIGLIKRYTPNGLNPPWGKVDTVGTASCSCKQK